MNKPKSFIRFERPRQFREFGLIIVGRYAFPVYILFNLGAFSTLGLVLLGLVVSSFTDAFAWGYLVAAAIPASITAATFAVIGIVLLIRGASKHIRLATRIARGEVKGY